LGREGNEIEMTHEMQAISDLSNSGDSLERQSADIADPPLNLHEYDAAARAVLPAIVYDYIARGAGDEVTLRSNRLAFDRWRLLPRVLRCGTATLSTTVLDQPVSMPILVAPMTSQRMAHPEGELASARAARDAGTVFILSTGSSYAIEDVAKHAGTWWFQVYFHSDRAVTRELVQRAEAAGASALVPTVDTPVLGRREADERNRFTLPEGVTFANFEPPYHVTPLAASGSSMARFVAMALQPTLDWTDLEWLMSTSSLPVIPKGILSPEDARIAIEVGARALIVSNHGGRQLDDVVATLDALPAVAHIAAGNAEVLVDGGIRRGTDVLKAMALGARAVLLGRPVYWGLAVGGEAGVERVLQLIRAELELDLKLSGCTTVDDISRSLIVPTGPLAGLDSALVVAPTPKASEPNRAITPEHELTAP
jgi:4-hydroxymandelate oxidase